jgi:hypothetical protein
MEKKDMKEIIGMLAIIEARMDTYTKTIQESMDAMHKKMMARMDAWLTDMNDNREQTIACQETMDACLECKEPGSAEMKLEVADEEVPLEDAGRMPVGEPRKWRRDRNLDARRRRKQQERTQNKDGCRKNLVATRRGTTRRARVAWRKRNILRKFWTQRSCGLRQEVTAAGMKISRCAGHRRKRPNKGDAERETRKGRTEEIDGGETRSTKRE